MVEFLFNSLMGGEEASNGGPTALVLPRFTIYAGGAGIEIHTWPHLRGLELADPDFLAIDPIEILLGVDVYTVIFRSGLRTGADLANL